jgi:3-oxoacyl-[acyl-carrier protein] reductase
VRALVTGAAGPGGIGAAIAARLRDDEAWLDRIPTGRLVKRGDVAAAAAFLASPAAGSVTGQELVIDGGQTLNALSVTRTVMRQDSMP